MKPPTRFNPAEYDDDGTLRIGQLLWLTMLYLSRHLLLLMIGAVSSLIGSRNGLDSSALATLYSAPQFLLASLPALLLIAAAIRRSPRAGKLPRWVWRHGKWWLLAAAIIDLLLLGIALTSGHQHLNELHGLWGVIDLYVLAYVLRSRRLPLVFADFPAPDKGRSP